MGMAMSSTPGQPYESLEAEQHDGVELSTHVEPTISNRASNIDAPEDLEAAGGSPLLEEPMNDSNMDETKVRGIRNGAVCFGIPFLACAVWWLHDIFVKDTLMTDGHRYLSSWGIGKSLAAGLLGALGLIFTAIGCCMPTSFLLNYFRGGHLKEDFEQGRDISLPVETRARFGFVDGEHLEPDVFKMSGMRVAKSVLLIGRTALNTYLVFHAFSKLPDRDPEERLNEARHWVGWVEVLLVCYLLGFATLFTIATAVAYKALVPKLPTTEEKWDRVGGNAIGACSLFKSASTFSVMQLIGNASPVKIAMAGQDTHSVMQSSLKDMGPIARNSLSIASAAAIMALRALLAGFGVMGLVVKINQVEFVTEEIISAGTVFTNPWGCVSLLGLASTIAGISSVDDARMDAVIEVACQGEEDRARKKGWRSLMQSAVIGYCIMSFNPVKACVLAMTLDANDFQRLLFKRKDA